MRKLLLSNYLILWIHIINLTFRIFYELSLPKLEINLDKFNIFLNNVLLTDYVFEDGVIDILTIITAIISFYISKYNLDSLLMLIFSTIAVEILIISNEKNGRILNSVLIVVCFYIIGKLTEKNRNTYLLEKSLKNENIFDEINIQEYEPYKLY